MMQIIIKLNIYAKKPLILYKQVHMHIYLRKESVRVPRSVLAGHDTKLTSHPKELYSK